MSRTIFLGRLLGPFLVAISVSMFAHRSRMLATLAEMARDGSWMPFYGMVANRRRPLAVVLAHDVWSGGAVAIEARLRAGRRS